MNAKSGKTLIFILFIIGLLLNVAIADDYDYPQSSYSPPAASFIMQTFSDSSSSSVPINTFNPGSNMNRTKWSSFASFPLTKRRFRSNQ